MLRDRIRLSAVGILMGLAAMLAGCKGGGQARSTDSEYATVDGPELASPAPPIDEGPNASLDSATALRTSRASYEPGPQRPQRTCPVSGKPLGAAGTPLTVTVHGEPLFVCSSSCGKKVQQNPDRYLARVRAETALGN